VDIKKDTIQMDLKKCILSIKGLNTNFRGQVVHNNLNLNVFEGEVLAVMGPSGSGKTSLINFIMGDAKSSSGELLWYNKYIDRSEINSRIGFAFQIGGLLSDMTILQNIAMPLIYVAGFNENDAMQIAGIAILSSGLDMSVFNKYPDMLSGGMYKKVVIAKSIVLGQKLLVLDEPLSGLDPISTKDVMSMIYGLTPKITIVCVTHNFIRANRYAIITPDHQLIVGTLDEVMQDEFAKNFIDSFREI
jgi:phospholipid/cholesterol/gamma-HCH transport system ATP-binding protein